MKFTTNQRRDLATAPPVPVAADVARPRGRLGVARGVAGLAPCACHGWVREVMQSPRPHVGRSEIFGLNRNLSSRNSDKNQGKSMLRQATLLQCTTSRGEDLSALQGATRLPAHCTTKVCDWQKWTVTRVHTHSIYPTVEIRWIDT